MIIMNRIKSLLANISWKTYLFIRVIHLICMPYIYKALLMMARKVPLSFYMNGVINSILFLVGALFLYKAHGTYVKQENRKHIKLVRKVLCGIGLMIYIPLIGALLEFVLNLISFSGSTTTSTSLSSVRACDTREVTFSTSSLSFTTPNVCPL